MTIGELAQRLRVTTRTLRHYAQLGLLLPERVDARNGYREYSEAQLIRGMRIEQLKATGLALATIRDMLDSGSDTSQVLRRRRHEIEGIVADH